MQKNFIRQILLLLLLNISTSLKYTQTGKISIVLPFSISTKTNKMQSSLQIGTNNNLPYKKYDFTIDIGSKTSWVNANDYVPSESTSFNDTDMKIEEFGDDDFSLKGNSAFETFYLNEGSLKAETVQFLTSIDTFNPSRGENGIGLGKEVFVNGYELASRLSDQISEETQMFAIEYLTETTETTGMGNLYFGDLDFLTSKKSVSLKKLHLVDEEGYKHKWAMRLKYIFYGSILDDRKKKINGVYSVSTKEPHWKVNTQNNLAFFETVYNKILLPENDKDALLDSLKKEYFQGTGTYPLCSQTPSIYSENITTFVCRGDAVIKLGQIHFVFEDVTNRDFDIYLDYNDLFFKIGEDRYEFLLGIHKDIPSTYRLGLPVIKKFTSIFDMKNKELYLASLSNKAEVFIDNSHETSDVRSVEFTLMTENNYLQTSVLVAKPQKELMFTIDIGSPKTWADQTQYPTESVASLDEDSLNNTLYELSGVNAQDVFEYGNVTLEKFDFFLAEKIQYVPSVIEPPKVVLGLGKPKDSENRFSIIYRMYQTKIDYEPKCVIEFGGDDPEGEKIGRIYYGKISSYLTPYQQHIYPVPLSLDGDGVLYYGKWSTILHYIFFGNILKEKKLNGRFKVSTYEPHIYFNKRVVFESNLNKIVLPYSRKDEIIDMLEDYYFSVDHQNKCEKKEDTTSGVITFLCDKTYIIAMNEFHIVLKDGMDLYFESQDLFDCEKNVDTCEFLVEFRPEYTDFLALGVTVLRKFRTLIDFEKRTFSLISTDNLDYVDVYTPSVIGTDLFGINFKGKTKENYLEANITFGSHRVVIPMTIDIGSSYTWVKQDKYDGKSQYFKIVSENQEYINADYHIYGNKVIDNVYGEGVPLHDFSFMHISKIEGENDFFTVLGLGSNYDQNGYSFIHQIYDKQFQKIPEYQRPHNRFLLQFNENDDEFYSGQLIYGIFDDFLESNKLISTTLKLDSVAGKKEKWVTNLTAIYFQNILVNRTSNGSFEVLLSTPNYKPKEYKNVVFETIYNGILIPYREKDTYMEIFKQHYFSVDKKHLCEMKTSKEIAGYEKTYFECSKENIEKLGPLHFILSNGLDIYLESKDLFKCTQNVCKSRVESRNDVEDRFIFGTAVLRKFQTLFDIDSDSITFIGEDNWDYVFLTPDHKDPIQEISFTYNTEKGFYTSPGFFGSNMDRIDFVVDIGGAKSWIFEHDYDYDASLSHEIIGDGEVHEEAYEIRGKIISDTFYYSNAKLDKFHFLVGQALQDTKLPGTIAFGRAFAEETQESYSIVRLMNKKLGNDNTGTFILQYDEDKTNGKSTGQVVFGKIDEYLKEKQYITDIPLTQLNGNKWAASLSRIYYGNILINKTSNNIYNVSTSIPYYNATNISIVFETVYDHIVIPYENKDAIFKEMNDAYFKGRCKKITDDRTFEYFRCDKSAIMTLDEIHFIIESGEKDVDLYFSAYDLFQCHGEECDMEIRADSAIKKNHFIFGNTFLKKFNTIFDLEKETMQIIGKRNKALVKHVNPNDMFNDQKEGPIPVDPSKPKEDGNGGSTTTVLVIILCILIVGGGAFATYYFLKNKKTRTVVVINENGSFGNINDSKVNELTSNTTSTNQK